MSKLVSTGIAILIALIIFASTVFVVDQRQFAIVFALGEMKTIISEPGLHFKLPPPFQNVVFLDKRILTIDLADLKPYFQGKTMRTGAPFWFGNTSPYIPKLNSASGCIASSMRKPST